MATFVQSGPMDLNTSLPQLQVATPTATSSAGVISTTGQAALQGFKAFNLRDMQESSEGLISELNQSLEDIDNNVDISDKLLSQLGEYAENNPHVQELKKTLGSLRNAEQQRQGAKMLYTLRAEVELKRVLARAPGLRNEVTQVARNTLGIDPTNATINAILRGIEPSRETDSDANLLKEEFRRVDDVRKSLGMASGTFTPETTWSDVHRMRQEANLMEQSVAEREHIKTQIAAGQESTPEIVSQFGAQMNIAVTAEINQLAPLVNNVLRSIETEAQYSEFAPILGTQIDAFETATLAAIDAEYAPLMSDARNLDMWTKQRDQIKDSVKQMTSSLREVASDRTALQLRLSGIQILQDQYKMDFLTSHTLLARLETGAPGLVRDLFTSFNIQNLQDRQDIHDAIGQVVRGMDPEEVKKLDLASMIDIVTGEKNLDDMDTETRERLAKKSFGTIKNFDKSFKEDPSKYSEEDMIGIAKSYATVLAHQGRFDSKDWAEVSNLTASPAFSTVVKTLRESGDLFSAEILADSAIQATGRAANGRINDTLKQYLHNTVGPASANNRASIVFDADSGKFILNKYREPGFGPLRAGVVAANSNLSLAVGKLNQMYDNLVGNDLLSHDPSLAGLDRAQLAYTMSDRLRRDNGIKVVGELKPFPQQDRSSPEESRDIKFEELASKTIDHFEKAVQQMQTRGVQSEEGKALLEELQQQLEEMRKLRQKDVALSELAAQLSR